VARAVPTVGRGVVMDIGENADGSNFTSGGMQLGYRAETPRGEGNYRLLLANVSQARIEERHEMVVRFEEEYRHYQQTTPLLGPFWFWATVLGGVTCLSIV
jgi:hypothetical protein